MDFSTLATKLSDIAEREGWTYHAPLEEAVLAAFEAAHGAVLPEPYRGFLRAACSGIDTDCMQLCPFERTLDELEGPVASVFPYDSAYGDAILQALAGGRTLRDLAVNPAFQGKQARGLPPGCIVIGELDGMRSALVITGEERGRVWQIGDFDIPETRHRHAGDGDLGRLDFEGWFACWLIENGLRL